MGHGALGDEDWATKELVVSTEERLQLESIARSQSLPAGIVRRAQMMLRMAYGESNSRYRTAFGSAARQSRCGAPAIESAALPAS